MSNIHTITLELVKEYTKTGINIVLRECILPVLYQNERTFSSWGDKVLEESNRNLRYAIEDYLEIDKNWPDNVKGK